MAKRILDFLLSGLGLLVLSPLFLVIAVWITLDSRGGVFFKSERVGRYGKSFLILKFRSMVEDAPTIGPELTAGEDARITSAGRFLRRTKLDELPQLVNVLRGQMSLVGPRPETRRYVEIFGAQYREILMIRPGMTDMASLEYREEAALLGKSDDPERLYIEEVLPEKIRLAAEYQRRSSLFFDLALIVRTLIDLARQQHLADAAAAAMVVLVMAAAALYPDSFISGNLMYGPLRVTPLSMLFPVVVIIGTVNISTHFRQLRPRLTDAALAAYLVYFTGRNIAGPEAFGALKYAGYAAILYYTCAVLVQRESTLKVLAWSIVVLAFITSIYGVMVEYFLQRNILYKSYLLDVVGDPKIGLYRIGSTLGHPVSFGAFLVQTIPFCIAAWYTNLGSTRRLLGASAVFMAFLALIMTSSKGSWLVAALMVLSLFILAGWFMRVRVIMLIIPVIFVLVLAVTVFWQQISHEMEWRTSISVNIRSKSWVASIEGISEHPLFGVGMRQGVPEMTRRLDPDWRNLTGEVIPIDNFYLSTLLEQGAAGMILWIAFLTLTVVSGIKICLRRVSSWPWALAALSSVVFLSLNAITFDAIFVWSNFIFFWIAAGILRGIVDGNGIQPSAPTDYEDIQVDKE